MSEHVYRSIEVTGSSKTGIEDAVENAVARAAKTMRHLEWFEVVETRGHLVDGKIGHWQVTVKLGFRLEE